MGTCAGHMFAILHREWVHAFSQGLGGPGTVLAALHNHVITQCSNNNETVMVIITLIALSAKYLLRTLLVIGAIFSCEGCFKTMTE